MRTLTLETPFALFSDVHGNLPGLEAILADIEQRGVPVTISLGDLVGYGPLAQRGRAARARPRHPHAHGQLRPGHRLRDRRLRLRLQDRRAARRRRGLARLDAGGRDRRGASAYLRTLEDHFTFATPAGDLLAVHGSPRRINEYLFEDRPDTAMARMADEYPYPAIFFGHTHVP